VLREEMEEEGKRSAASWTRERRMLERNMRASDQPDICVHAFFEGQMPKTRFRIDTRGGRVQYSYRGTGSIYTTRKAQRRDHNDVLEVSRESHHGPTRSTRNARTLSHSYVVCNGVRCWIFGAHATELDVTWANMQRLRITVIWIVFVGSTNHVDNQQMFAVALV